MSIIETVHTAALMMFQDPAGAAKLFRIVADSLDNMSNSVKDPGGMQDRVRMQVVNPQGQITQTVEARG
jgi:hypothetical protein